MLTWSVLLGLVVLGILGTAFFLWARANMSRKAVVASEIPEERVVEKRVVSAFESPTEDEALDLVKRALGIREPAEVAACFHPGTASPGRVIDFLKEMEETDGRVEGVTWLGSMDANGLLIDGVLVREQKDGKLKSRLAFLTPDEEGVWRVDFDAFARTVEPSWSELLEKNAATGLVRVIVAADTYYNGPFRDDSQWVCYRMVSPDTETALLGYARKDSPQARAMARIVSSGDVLPESRTNALPAKRATLRVRRVAGGDTRQFEITRVLAEDWVLADAPFDVKFE